MISKLELLLELNNKDYDYNISSILHGIIMEIIPDDYATYLHNQKISPFSMSITKYQDKLLWTINSLDNDSYKYIIKKLMKTSEIFMKQKNLSVKVKKISLIKNSYEKLVKENYYNVANERKEYTLYFQTPTAFKNVKEYIILPDIRLFFRSTMVKFDSFSESSKTFDAEVLKFIEDTVKIKKYKIKSGVMHLHNQKIPGFVGEITINASAATTINNLISLLVAYSEYCGVGIKCALGMGSVSLIKPQPLSLNSGLNEISNE